MPFIGIAVLIGMKGHLGCPDRDTAEFSCPMEPELGAYGLFCRPAKRDSRGKPTNTADGCIKIDT